MTWPFRWTIHSQLRAIEARLERTEAQQEQDKREQQEVQERLHLLETQADVIAKKYLQRT